MNLVMCVNLATPIHQLYIIYNWYVRTCIYIYIHIKLMGFMNQLIVVIPPCMSWFMQQIRPCKMDHQTMRPILPMYPSFVTNGGIAGGSFSPKKYQLRRDDPTKIHTSFSPSIYTGVGIDVPFRGFVKHITTTAISVGGFLYPLFI